MIVCALHFSPRVDQNVNSVNNHVTNQDNLAVRMSAYEGVTQVISLRLIWPWSDKAHCVLYIPIDDKAV